MPSKNQLSGNKGEKTAEQYLRRLGYRVLDRNFRFKRKEIDLICLSPGRDDNQIVFIEVKARSSRAYGAPECAVTLPKQRSIIRVAMAYMTITNRMDMEARFDVISVTLYPKIEVEIHLKDAFCI